MEFGTTRSFPILAVLVPLISIGKCPLTESDDFEATIAHPPPGRYYVEKSNDAAQAFAFPRVRGDSGQWLELPTVPDGYAESGIYELTANGEWSLITVGGHEVLDDLLMLWDPAPPVPLETNEPELSLSQLRSSLQP